MGDDNDGCKRDTSLKPVSRFKVNGYLKSYGGNDYLLPKLAAFLMGAGANTYFTAVGEYWTCDSEQQVVPEFGRPLGTPRGLATVQNGTTGRDGTPVARWTRSFGNGTFVELNVTLSLRFDPHHDVHCCIFWSSGEISVCPGSDCPKPPSTMSQAPNIEAPELTETRQASGAFQTSLAKAAWNNRGNETH